MSQTRTPHEDSEVLARWGTDNLTRVIAIDSQSDENSETIPSSRGQRDLSDHLRAFFHALGYDAEQDDNANLMVTIPANLPAGTTAPAIAMMVHMDTSEGTLAVPSLQTTAAWDGSRIRYPDNDRLQISAKNYPQTACFEGDDLLHGPGRYPVGLDDKLGMAELMTLAQVLQQNPDIPHGTLLLVFRPDEEISRMEAVDSLADELARRGIQYGYTIDGIEPFEINTENFNASRGRVSFAHTPLAIDRNGVRRRLRFRIGGVNTHGATAKAEGHRNATVMWARALDGLGDRDDIWPVGFVSDPRLECNAEITFLLCGDSPGALDAAERDLVSALTAEIEPHKWKGAYLEPVRVGSTELDERGNAEGADKTDSLDGIDHSDAVLKLGRHLRRFLSSPGVEPLLAEDSEGFQGYSNPYAVVADDRAAVLHYRLRDFDPQGLAGREEHLRQLCRDGGIDQSALQVDRQYTNMGPKLAAYPELVMWAEEALRAMGRDPVRRPIRGGTGVDPFLERDIPVANLGTGYFAPESEKEFTSRQNIARHTLWLTHLVQVIASKRSTGRDGRRL
ncbi:MAG: M20/M25/M40 family metallo-hydrolase [Proteobacteria bacterium]|nr:M20/M25/M40 family metallo-hydrolase [Pseudomonadota bacterium]